MKIFSAPVSAASIAAALGFTPVANVGGTIFLAGDVALNDTANFQNGPATPSLPAGTYELTADASVSAAAAHNIVAQIFDGTAAVKTARGAVPVANQTTTISFGVILTIAVATTFTLQVKDVTANTGTLLRSTANATTANLATSISYKRLT